MGKVKAASEKPADKPTEIGKAEIVARLVEGGMQLPAATMYADLFLEYREATRNIEANGVIVQHPRTMNPIDNPYLPRRDKARRELEKLAWVRADWLWATLLGDE